jgi:hypothetical protein
MSYVSVLTNKLHKIGKVFGVLGHLNRSPKRRIGPFLGLPLIENRIPNFKFLIQNFHGLDTSIGL